MRESGAGRAIAQTFFRFRHVAKHDGHLFSSYSIPPPYCALLDHATPIAVGRHLRRTLQL
jgi:hypothetical protein